MIAFGNVRFMFHMKCQIYVVKSVSLRITLLNNVYFIVNSDIWSSNTVSNINEAVFLIYIYINLPLIRQTLARKPCISRVCI